MRKNYHFVKKIFIVTTILMILELILLIMEPDTKHIALSCVVAAGWIMVLIIMLVLFFETRKCIYECQDENYCVRLVEYDDYQLIRTLSDDTPLSNSIEEVKLLQEYEQITTDYVRIRYHYLVLKGQDPICVFYAKRDNKIDRISFCACQQGMEEEIKHLIAHQAEKHHKEIIYE